MEGRDWFLPQYLVPKAVCEREPVSDKGAVYGRALLHGPHEAAYRQFVTIVTAKKQTMLEHSRFREDVASRRLRGARSNQGVLNQQCRLRPEAQRLCFFEISARVHLD